MAKYLILAASSGIGRATAELLHEQGHALFLTARSRERIESLADLLGSSHAAVELTDFAATEDVFSLAASRLGALDGVVNCAGSVVLKAAHATSRQSYEEAIAASLTTAFSTVRAAAAKMSESGSSVVLIASAAAVIGLANHEAIAAAKAGVVGLTLSAAATYAHHNIRFNAVAPGLTQTPATESLTRNPTARRVSQAMHALGRLGEPADIARAIAFLLDPANSWITGQVLAVDGGLSRVHPRVNL
jgi:NAD(P)-dependent dehydrogenase (short-subunit alcohol dehydrogenase family)